MTFLLLPLSTRLRATTRPHRGQAVMETALVLPILLVLMFGIAEFGLYMYDYVQAANCAREAARRAAVRHPDAESPPYCVSATLQPTVTPSDYEDQPGGSDVTAAVDSTHEWLVIGDLVPGLPSPMPLKATVVMRMEGQEVRG
jgi:Flp pilus assembly protein TadG